MVLEEAPADGTIYLYGGNKVSSRGATDGVGETIHRKIDGLTGETLWSYSIPAALDEGTMATPHVGKGDLQDLVIFACSDVSVTVDGQAQYGGLLVARNKDTGEVVWQVEQISGYWASPVVIYDQNEKGYVLQCDRNGLLRMYDGISGQQICEVDLGSRIESTPAVFNNMLVVGTRGQYGRGEGQKIIGVMIK